MPSTVKKFGNSSGVVIPKPLLSELGMQAGDSVDMRIEAGRLIIERAARPARSGWAEDAKALATAGDDAPIWPHFANEDDDELTW